LDAGVSTLAVETVDYLVRKTARRRGLLGGLLLCWLMALTVGHALVGARLPWQQGGGGSGASQRGGGLNALLPAVRAPASAALGAADPRYWLRREGDGFTAATPSQGFHASFSAGAASVTAGALRLSMALRGAGYGSPAPLPASAPSRVSRNRVEDCYRGGALCAWYVNGPAGLEQGFTLARAPAAGRRATRAGGGPAGAGEPLTLALALASNAHAALAADGESVTLSGGGELLRYGSLRASDAGGRALRSWMQLRGGRLLLRVDAAGARYPLRIDPLVEQASKLTTAEAETTEGEQAGYSVALSSNGQEALVGAPGFDENRGAAWAFVRSGTEWVQQGPALLGGEERRNASFGHSVALSGDGQTALIGGQSDRGQHGAAWAFVLVNGTWEQQGPKLTGGAEESGGARFGNSVALSQDGNTALVGGLTDEGGRGAVWVFTRSEEVWTQEGAKLTGGGEEEGEGLFGRSVALSADGDTALVGAFGDDGAHGAAWVFTRSGSLWTQQGPKLTAQEEQLVGHFGTGVALSSDGETALIGGHGGGGIGAAWVFTRSGSSWSQQGPELHGGEIKGNDDFGDSVALSGDGDTALIGGERDNAHAGAAWVFVRSGGVWLQSVGKLTGYEAGEKGWFGKSVALSGDGEEALVGGPHANVEVGEDKVVESHVGAVWTLVGETPPPPPPPTVTKVSPDEGPEAGGTHVTITGSGFVAGATVTIGGEAGSVHVVSGEQITAVTSATAAGSYTVVVHDADGTSSGGPSFTYLPAAPVTPEPEPEPEPEPAPGTTTNGSPTGSTTSTGAGGVLGTLVRSLPPPQLGVSGNLTPVSGEVLVKLPGSSTFVPLTEAEQVPFGTIVNATNGKVEVTTMGPHGLQSMYFYGGEFRLVQRRNGLVVAILTGGSFKVCPTKRERAHVADATASAKHAGRKHVVRKLWSSGHGSYATQGNYASGAVLGTVWLTEDRCDGTLIYVATDRVRVTNRVNHRHRTVKAGHAYLAKAPKG